MRSGGAVASHAALVCTIDFKWTALPAIPTMSTATAETRRAAELYAPALGDVARFWTAPSRSSDGARHRAPEPPTETPADWRFHALANFWATAGRREPARRLTSCPAGQHARARRPGSPRRRGSRRTSSRSSSSSSSDDDGGEPPGITRAAFAAPMTDRLWTEGQR